MSSQHHPKDFSCFRTPPGECLEKPLVDFTDEDIENLNNHWTFQLSFPSTGRTRASPLAPMPDWDDPKNIDSILTSSASEFRRTVFNKFPLRVLKLPEKKFMERDAVADYFIRNKLEVLWKKLLEEESSQGNNLNIRVDASSPFHRVRDEIRQINSLQEDINLLRSKARVPRTDRMFVGSGIHSRKVETLSEKINVLRKKVIFDAVDIVTKFAVLSHTWGEDELSYQDFLSTGKHNANSRGRKKLDDFCRIALQDHNAEFVWTDTVCIDKLNPTELDESIRSMFAWYRNSFICIIHLARSISLVDFPLDRWFTRGWTLQEILAPLRIKFYNREWKPITILANDKQDESERGTSGLHYIQSRLLSNGIATATGISITDIRRFRPGLRDPPFPQRMKWIARRTTTRSEDMSYAMMGVLGISMSVAYGEGAERAFFRLFKEVLDVDYSFDWFLWGGKPIPRHIHPSRMIPSSPQCYLSWDPECQDESHIDTREPLSLTNIGLPVKLLVVPASLEWAGAHRGWVTSPLSDRGVDIAFEPPMPTESLRFFTVRYALGIHYIDNSDPQSSSGIYAIPLYKTIPRADSGLDGFGNRWHRCEADVVGFDRLAECFRKQPMSKWVNISVPRYGALEGSEVPKIEFKTLYL